MDPRGHNMLPGLVENPLPRRILPAAAQNPAAGPPGAQSVLPPPNRSLAAGFSVNPLQDPAEIRIPAETSLPMVADADAIEEQNRRFAEAVNSGSAAYEIALGSGESAVRISQLARSDTSLSNT